ncbi:MAG: hypothetical protein Hyperionvirus16_53 [Hyperionvirus sp.]|uniref:Uncharacterized protein n=1 Tax=Hyperionvirus sp. TaxID=2487770 RepID=A0A3G5A9Z6_9VIRU|nr:MAG: hypothetical protein Hyperionvirus16_53 [Hyperionvirus sp.]
MGQICQYFIIIPRLINEGMQAASKLLSVAIASQNKFCKFSKQEVLIFVLSKQKYFKLGNAVREISSTFGTAS